MGDTDPETDALVWQLHRQLNDLRPRAGRAGAALTTQQSFDRARGRGRAKPAGTESGSREHSRRRRSSDGGGGGGEQQHTSAQRVKKEPNGERGAAPRRRLLCACFGPPRAAAERGRSRCKGLKGVVAGAASGALHGLGALVPMGDRCAGAAEWIPLRPHAARSAARLPTLHPQRRAAAGTSARPTGTIGGSRSSSSGSGRRSASASGQTCQTTGRSGRPSATSSSRRGRSCRRSPRARRRRLRRPTCGSCPRPHRRRWSRARALGGGRGWRARRLHGTTRRVSSGSQGHGSVCQRPALFCDCEQQVL